MSAATATAATAATTEAGLSGSAVSDERAELLCDLHVPAIGAGRIGIGHPDELLEMGLAAHADVFVDRHQGNLSNAILAALSDVR